MGLRNDYGMGIGENENGDLDCMRRGKKIRKGEQKERGKRGTGWMGGAASQDFVAFIAS